MQPNGTLQLLPGGTGLGAALAGSVLKGARPEQQRHKLLGDVRVRPLPWGAALRLPMCWPGTGDGQLLALGRLV
eukprot:6281-Chlamydomonas_euryale.AAC.6